MLATRGLGPVNLLCTAGLGPYKAFIVAPPQEPDQDNIGGGRKQFEVMPRRIFLRSKVGEPTLRLADIKPEEAAEILSKATEIVVEGESYLVTGAEMPTPKQALELLPPSELTAKIEAVKKELGVSKRMAIAALKKRAKKEIVSAQEFKLSLVREDDELALIIILSEA